jgi:hypothetical protein
MLGLSLAHKLGYFENIHQKVELVDGIKREEYTLTTESHIKQQFYFKALAAMEYRKKKVQKDVKKLSKNVKKIEN